MTLILRKDKDAPLTVQEMDGNFEHLEKRIDQLEGDTFAAESFSAMQATKEGLLIEGSQGSRFGPLAWPSLFRARGVWQAGEFYIKGDVVQNGSALYSLQQDESQEDVFDLEQWQVVFEISEKGMAEDRPSSVFQEASIQKPDMHIPVFTPHDMPMGSEGMMILVRADANVPRPAFFNGENWVWLYTGEPVQKESAA